MSTDPRRGELARIHIAKQQLRMDEETYRNMLWTVGRVKSAADLDFAGRARVLEHLRGLGFQDRGAPNVRRLKKDPKDKARMLWRIRERLKVAVPPRTEAYADGMAEKMFHVKRLVWCEPDQLHRLLAALEKDGQRHGWKLGGNDEPRRA